MSRDSEVAKIIKTELEIKVTSEDVDDIMVGALEGGINYWAKAARVKGEYLGEYGSEQISRGGSLVIVLKKPFDDEDTTEYELTPEKFYKGIEMYCKNPTACNCLEQIDGYLRIDCCNADAEVCDAIIQYALFEEIIFG